MEYMWIIRILTGFLSDGWSLALFPSSRNESEPHAEYRATAIYTATLQTKYFKSDPVATPDFLYPTVFF